MVIPNEKIEEVRLASDIADVVSGYLTLRKRGRNYFGLCPFHTEKTASFSVNPDMQIFHCFGCGAGGNVFTFVMKIEGLTFPESVKLLAQAAGIILPEEAENLDNLREKEALFYANQMAAEFYQENLQSAEATEARHYLEQRDLNVDVCSTFGIGYAPDKWNGLLRLADSRSMNPEMLLKAGLVLKHEDGRYYDRFRGRVTFAIRNLSGQVVAFGARRIVEDNSPKYINSPETVIYQKRYTLYGLFQAREAVRRADEVIVVEGYTDWISMSRAGVQNVVATSGTALTEEHSRLLRRYTSNAILLFDSDSAGASAAMRGADILLESGMEVKICLLPSGKDPDELARKQGAEAVRQAVAQSVPLVEFKLRDLQQSGQMHTPSHRSEATRNLLTSIAKVSDHIKRSFLVRDLAEKLHVEEAVLWSEIGKIDRQTRIRSKTEAREEKDPSQFARFFESKRGSAELGLFEIVLTNTGLIPSILRNVTCTDFFHPEIRELFQQLESSAVAPQNFDPQRFLGTVQDPVMAKRLSDKLFKEEQQDKVQKVAYDCLIRLQLAKVDDEIEQIRKQIQQAQGSGSNTAELLNQYKQLVEEREGIEAGKYIV
jgi:DNA primase